MQKPCPRCHTVKPAAAFFSDRSRPDGLSYYCRECTRELQRQATRHSAASFVSTVSSASIE